MAQIHSYLIMNAKSELKYLNEEITLEELDETFNQIASSIVNENDLFEDDNESEINFILEDHEIIDLEGINNNDLEITDFIDLSSSLLKTNNIDFTIEKVTLAPDGFTRQLSTVNGQFPGPTIEVNKGDRILMKIRNKLGESTGNL